MLFLLMIVGGAYLLTHFVAERLERRFLFRSGVEYVLLGIVLGPTVVAEVHPFTDLTALGPVFAFAAGWVGLLYGMELRRVEFDSVGRPLRLAATDLVVTGALVAAGAWGFFQSGVAMEVPNPRDAALCAGVLGCAAAAGSSSAVDLLAHRYAEAETHLLPMLRRAAKLGDALAISVFGVLFAVYHQGAAVEQQASADWILWTVGLGVGLGFLFYLFLGRDEGENNVFLAMVGILLFASGAAFFLEISALAVNLVLGAILAQYTTLGARLRKQLVRTEAPVSLLLLLFAGALWEPVHPLPAVVLTLGFVGLRLVGKVLAVFLATVGTPLRGDLFRGMLAQGDAAVAMAVSFQLVYDGEAVNLAYTAIICSVVIHEFVSPRLLRGLLVDAGELRQDVAWAGR